MTDTGTELVAFHSVTSVAPNGELLVNAGKYSRAMIVMAFEMMGGAETFAEWAMNNKGDFYTKIFSKTIGREIEIGAADPIENYLAVLDLPAEEITSEDADPELVSFVSDTLLPAKLAYAAEVYASGEPVD